MALAAAGRTGRAEPGRSRAAGEPCPVLVTGSSVIRACGAGCHGVSWGVTGVTGVTGVSEPCSAVWCHPVVCCAMLSCAVPCSAKPRRAKLCRARAQQLGVPWAGGSTAGAVDGSDSPGTFPLAKGTWPGGAPSRVPPSLAMTPGVWSCHWCCRTGVGTRLPQGRGASGPCPSIGAGPQHGHVSPAQPAQGRGPRCPPAASAAAGLARGCGAPGGAAALAGPSGGGAAERQRLFPAPAPRKRVGGQEGRAAAGSSTGTGRDGTGAGAAGRGSALGWVPASPSPPWPGGRAGAAEPGAW